MFQKRIEFESQNFQLASEFFPLVSISRLFICRCMAVSFAFFFVGILFLSFFSTMTVFCFFPTHPNPLSNGPPHNENDLTIALKLALWRCFLFTNIDVIFLLIFKFASHRTIACIVSTANKPLVGTLITTGDVTRNIAISSKFDYMKRNTQINLTRLDSDLVTYLSANVWLIAQCIKLTDGYLKKTCLVDLTPKKHLFSFSSEDPRHCLFGTRGILIDVKGNDQNYYTGMGPHHTNKER